MSLFRGGSEEAFRAIHDRYRQRMFAYTRQMLSGSAVDAEDAVQEIFVRAYSGLRSSDRELALRAWLYRIAHNRCIDELRRPQSVATEAIPPTVPNAGGDPVTRVEQRDALKRLIADVQRLPDQQRSALLMRELTGMTYADVAGALGVSVPAVKSLLVRARVGLAQANEARDTACGRIREDLIVAHDRGVRASGLARRHLRDCAQCREFRSEVRGVSRQLAAFVPALGPIGVIAKLLGIGGGGGAAAGTGALAGGGASAGATAAATSAAGGLAGSGAFVGLGALAGTGHVVTILAAAVVTAGGAIELQHMTPPPPQRAHHHHAANRAPARAPDASASTTSAASASSASVSQTSNAPASSSVTPATSAAANPLTPTQSSTRTGHRQAHSGARTTPLPLTQRLDPDHLSTLYGPGNPLSLVDPSDPTATPVPSSPTSTSSPDGTSDPSSTDPNAPLSPAGTSSSTPVGTTPTSVTSTGSDGTTQASTPTSSTSATGNSGPVSSSSTSSSASTGSQGSTGSQSSTQGSGRTTKVVPAASKGSIGPSKIPAASRSHRHGTIAVFTMTGN